MVFILLMAFELKHFLADYVLRREALPRTVAIVAYYSSIHALLTLAIVICTAIVTGKITLTDVTFLTTLDFLVQLLLYKFKASEWLGMKSMGLATSRRNFERNATGTHNHVCWVISGQIQMAHHCFNYALIFIITTMLNI